MRRAERRNPWRSTTSWFLLGAGLLMMLQLWLDVSLHRHSWPGEDTASRQLPMFAVVSRNNTLSPQIVVEEKKTKQLSTNPDVSAQEQNSPYAYVYVVNRSQRGKLTGFLYNMLVSVQLLRQMGSTKTDFVLLLPNSCSSESSVKYFTENESKWLTMSGVQIDHFDAICEEADPALDKLTACLSQTHYRKVLFMDAAGILPVRNLDYLFAVSDETSEDRFLEENVVWTDLHTPSFSGMFLVAPKDADSLPGIIDGAREWMPEEGWGFKMGPLDSWVSRKDKGRLWTFPMASSDQGLLYYWTKYHRRSVSFVFEDEVENWSLDKEGKMIKTKVMHGPFFNHSKPGLLTSVLTCQQLFCDVVRFESKKDQPWRRAPTSQHLQPIKRNRTSDFRQLWWSTFQEINLSLDMGFDLTNWVPPMDTNSQFDTKELTRGAQQNTNTSDYAFAFVIGGCDPATQGYKGFVYNILVATRVLRQQGSVSDVIAFFQMKHESYAEVLPPEDVRLLKALGVQILYIPKSPSESFYDTVMNKFRVLSLTQYRRVILMDGDVVPVRNLDYLFEISDPAYSRSGQHTFVDSKTGEVKPLILKENVIVAGKQEPANAGFFLVSPEQGGYERIQDIIDKRAQVAADTLSHKKAPFDELHGWGHQIVPPDSWTTRSTANSGTNWTFHFAYSDQGHLYHWTKYVKQSVSIVFKGYVENWSASEDGTAVLEDTFHDPFAQISVPGPLDSSLACNRFMCDFFHYSGKGKPWLRPPSPEFLESIPEGTGVTDSPERVWWSTLKVLNEELHIGLDFDHWTLDVHPDLGMWANRKDLTKHVNDRAAVK